jgi:hypothetical protein
MSGHNGDDPSIINENKRFRKNYLKQKHHGITTDHDGSKLFGDDGYIDTHARPMYHLEYLQKILPEIIITTETQSWTETQHSNAVVHNMNFTGRNSPRRF